MVLLRHTLPDGSHHFDWVLATCPLEDARAEPDVRDAVTFRVPNRVDQEVASGGARRLLGERLADHRRRYLWFTGELGPGTDGAARGRVDPVATGAWCPSVVTAGKVRFFAEFKGGPRVEWLWERDR